MPSKMAQQDASLHATVTVSCSASAGSPRSASSRRSRRISSMALAKFSRASSFVRPCPFAPGTSGQYAICQLSSRSKMAVNVLLIIQISFDESSRTLPPNGPGDQLRGAGRQHSLGNSSSCPGYQTFIAECCATSGATRGFRQLNPAEAKAIARRNHLSISLNTGHLLPRRKGVATQDSIIRCPQQMSADAKQIVHLAVNAQKSLRLS